MTASMLSGMRSVEQITFAAGNNMLTLDSTTVANNGGILSLVETGSGNLTVNAAALGATSRIAATLGTGTDTLTGGAGADSFRIAVNALTSADKIDGGTGIDTLQFSTTGTISAASLANVVNIDVIGLAGVTGDTNSLTLSNQFFYVKGVAPYRPLQIHGRSGNDTIDCSAVTLGSPISITAGAGDDVLKGGAEADTFIFAANQLNSHDTVAGGSGIDTLQFTTAGTFAAYSLGHVSRIGIIIFGGTSGQNNSIVLKDAFVTANTGSASSSLTITGGATNDSVDGSGVTLTDRHLVFNPGTGADTLKGGAGADTFNFTAAALTSDDTVAGGAGNDTLKFTTSGTIAAASLAHVTGIEKFILGVGAANNVLTLSDAIVAANTSASSTVITINGSSVSDIVDGSAVTAADRQLVMIASTGDDTLKGGAGDDTFSFAASALTNKDYVSGGGGNNTLIFSVAGTISAASLAHVSGIGTFDLGPVGDNDLTLDQAVIDANTGVGHGTITINGGAGNDTIDDSAQTATARALVIHSGAGNDTLKTGAGNDSFYFEGFDLTSADSIDGGGGIDTLVLTSSGAADLTNVRNIETIDLAAAGNSIVLSDALVASATGGPLTIYGGVAADSVDATAVGEGRTVTFRADKGDHVTYAGGADNDIVQIQLIDLSGDTLTGGDGMDTLQLLSPRTFGPADFANVSGFETIALNGAVLCSKCTKAMADVTPYGGLRPHRGCGA